MPRRASAKVTGVWEEVPGSVIRWIRYRESGVPHREKVGRKPDAIAQLAFLTVLLKLDGMGSRAPSLFTRERQPNPRTKRPFRNLRIQQFAVAEENQRPWAIRSGRESPPQFLVTADPIVLQ